VTKTGGGFGNSGESHGKKAGEERSVGGQGVKMSHGGAGKTSQPIRAGEGKGTGRTRSCVAFTRTSQEKKSKA